MKKERPNSPLLLLQYAREHLRLWMLAVLALLAVAGFSFYHAIQNSRQVDPGWQRIQVTEEALVMDAWEFQLQYDIQTDQEYRALGAAYTQALGDGLAIFDQGLAELNAHPNAPVAVDGALLDALNLLEDSRYGYFAPMYEQYRGVYSCIYEEETALFDPAQDPELLKDLQEAAAFSRDPQAIWLEQTQEGLVVLRVSPEYARYAQENEQQAYLDLFWLRDGFLVDYVADRLQEQGFDRGIFSSYSGFSRILGAGDYSLTFAAEYAGNTMAASVPCQGSGAVVAFRNKPTGSQDALRYFTFSSGETRTPFLDPETLLCKSAVASLTAMWPENNCVSLALKLLPVYIADSLEQQTLIDLTDQGIHSLWSQEDVLYYTNSQQPPAPATNSQGNSFRLQYVGR